MGRVIAIRLTGAFSVLCMHVFRPRSADTRLSIMHFNGVEVATHRLPKGTPFIGEA